MRPRQVSAILYRIADAIDNSKNPSIEQVSQDISKVTKAITADADRMSDSEWDMRRKQCGELAPLFNELQQSVKSKDDDGFWEAFEKLQELCKKTFGLR